AELEARLAALEQTREEEGRARDELRERVGRLRDEAEHAARLRAELEDTRAHVDALGERIEQVRAEPGGDEEARRLLAQLRAEVETLRSGTAEGAAGTAELERMAGEVGDALAAAREAAET